MSAIARAVAWPRQLGGGTLLTATVLVSALLLVAKLGGLVVRGLPDGVPVARAEAQEIAASPAPAVAPPMVPPRAPEAAAVHGRAVAEGASGGQAASPPDPATLSPGEIELLQRLRERRAELEERERRLELRAAALEIAEAGLRAQVERLEALREDLRAELERRTVEDGERLQSLIKIYETMKPKDAAAIFDRLEMPVLLAVVGGMREAKAAPVIAAMDRERAEQLTRELAEQRHPPTPQE